MSSFLELVQDLHRESGASGQTPTSVASQVGESRRLVNWVRDADTYIQELWQNWKFKRAEYAEVASIGVRALPVVSDADFYDEITFFYAEPGSTDQNPLELVEYDTIKREVRDTNTGPPDRIVLMPDNTLELDPIPDQAYEITGDYYINSVEMANNSDISIIPARYHKVILGRALILYGNYESAWEAKTQGQEIYSEQLARLENNQLPNVYSSRFRTGGSIEVIAE